MHRYYQNKLATTSLRDYNILRSKYRHHTKSCPFTANCVQKSWSMWCNRILCLGISWFLICLVNNYVVIGHFCRPKEPNSTDKNMSAPSEMPWSWISFAFVWLELMFNKLCECTVNALLVCNGNVTTFFWLAFVKWEEFSSNLFVWVWFCGWLAYRSVLLLFRLFMWFTLLVHVRLLSCECKRKHSSFDWMPLQAYAHASQIHDLMISLGSAGNRLFPITYAYSGICTIESSFVGLFATNHYLHRFRMKCIHYYYIVECCR